MDLNFKKWNNILGVAMFLIAAVVYLLTMERHLSLWDCGEYIVSSAKLGVTHAPGAALFQLFGAVWAGLSFGDGGKYAILINSTSALFSAGTIMLLFWTITYFARKMFINQKDLDVSVDDIQLNATQKLITLGSGLVGAAIFMFSDTFWFSAVEGEVYAMSSFFTAVIAWLITKWDPVADNERGNKWLVIISLFIGLSIGVHLMAILAVPLVCYVYYARKYKFTIKSFIIANLITLAVLAFTFKIIFPVTMTFLGKTEVYVVNNFGLPFHSGTIIAAVILLAVVYGIFKVSKKYGSALINTIAWCITFMLVGFSCWLVIPIRANANPHMNLNDPDTALGVLDYFNREQYGNWPVMYGPVYTAHIADDGIQKDANGNYERVVTGADYVKDNRIGQYVKVSDRIDYVYNDKYMKVFPKMFNPDPSVMENYAAVYGFPEFSLNASYYNDQNAQQAYAELMSKKESKSLKIADLRKYNEILDIEPPTLLQQVNYFLDYQVGYMFLRYLMWNFSGRQNDLEGNFEVTKGNWISGFSFIDNPRLGDQSILPAEYINDGTNVYYMLPLILGIIGMFFQLNRNFTNWWGILSLFFLTSIGIIIYTSVKPFEPRERDYALVSSFFAFSIWCGLGVQGLYFIFKKLTKKEVSTSLASGIVVVSLGIPALMGFQNWDDHDRSERAVAYSLAYNYINPLDKNAILFVYGDNDTYPLWGLQETENFREDVKIANLTLAASPWNLEQLLRRTYNAEGIPTNLKTSDFQSGTNDNIFMVAGSIKNIFEQLNSMTKTGPNGEKIALSQLANMSEEQASQFLVDPELDVNQILSVYKGLAPLEKFITNDTMTAKEAINFILDNKSETKKALADYVGYRVGPVNFLPVSKIKIPVNKANALKYGIVAKEDADKMVDEIVIDIQKSTLYKSDLMMISMLANYNWDRPIYFSGGGVADPSNTFFLNDYLMNTGLTYKFVPIYKEFGKGGVIGSSNLNELSRVFYSFRSSNFENPKASFSITERMYTSSYRNVAVRLADDLLKAGKRAEAVKVLDRIMELIPAWTQYDVGYGVSRIAGLYLKAGEDKKAKELFDHVRKESNDKLNFFNTLSIGNRNTVARDIGATKSDIMMALFNEVSALSEKGDKEKALARFQKDFAPLKAEFEKMYKDVISDGKVDPNEETRLMNQLNFLNELIGVAAEVDTIYAKKQQDLLYAIVGE